MDLIQIKTNLDLFSVQYDQDESEMIRNVLKKYLLTEILKSPEHANSDFLKTCLNETDLALNSRKQLGYLCVFVGCKYQGSRHHRYVMHVKKEHPNLKNIPCNFQKRCKQIFGSIEGLVKHVKNAHTTQNLEVKENPAAVTVVDEPCKCDRYSCGGLKFTSIKLLMRHYNSFHANEQRPCIFSRCQTVLHAACPTSALNHFRIKHKVPGNLHLQPQYLIQQTEVETHGSTAPPIDDMECNDLAHDDVTDDERYTEIDLEALNDDDNTEDNTDEEADDYYLQYYSHFLNKLAHFKFVPHTTVQDIIEESINNTKKSLDRQERLLRKSLPGIGASPADVEQIVSNVYKDDPFLQAQLLLNTEYKRLTHIQGSDNYVHPKEILLNEDEVRQQGSKKEVYHYVSIIESLKVLVTDPSFRKMITGKVTANEDGKLRDLKDGSHYKSSEFFQQNRDAYTAILYSDAVEMKNPLGSAKGTYKLVQVYYSLCEIEKSQRSQIDRFQLIMVFREKLLKKYSIKTVMKPLIDDLKKLEIGVEIKVPETRRLKLGVLCYTSDNLEATVIGGFSGSFSSRDICRICHIQHKDLENAICDEHDLWTIEEYDLICTSEFREEDDVAVVNEEVNADNLFALEGDSHGSDDASDESEGMGDEPLATRGLKSECSFNVLKSFHATTSFPLDLMHDLFEGEQISYSIHCLLMFPIFD